MFKYQKKLTDINKIVHLKYKIIGCDLNEFYKNFFNNICYIHRIKCCFPCHCDFFSSWISTRCYPICCVYSIFTNFKHSTNSPYRFRDATSRARFNDGTYSTFINTCNSCPSISSSNCWCKVGR